MTAVSNKTQGGKFRREILSRNPAAGRVRFAAAAAEHKLFLRTESLELKSRGERAVHILAMP